MVFVPGGKVAVPAVMPPLTSALVANGVPLAENTTLPVGRSAAGGTPFTVAVNVTLVPDGAGFTDEASKQEVTYCAVIAFVPNGREAVLALALPLTSALVVNGVPLTEKTTLPVGRSAAGGQG